MHFLKDKHLPTTSFEIIILLFVTSCTIFGVMASWVDLTWYEEMYAVEDGFIEWLTVVALLAVSGTMFYYFFKLYHHKPRLFLATLLFIGGMGIFGAGEEISWGQRIFNIESTGYFVTNNSQQETNLHNMVINGTKINKLVFSKLLMVAVFIYLILFPIVYNKSPKLRKFTDEWAGVAVPKLYHIFFFLLFLGLASACPSGKRAELIEFSSCFMFLLVFLFPQNKVIFSRKEVVAPLEHEPELLDEPGFSSNSKRWYMS